MRTSLIGRVGLLLGLLVALPLAVPTLAAPPAHAAKGGDGGQEMKAREAFAAGRYDDALDLFAKLYAQTLHPVYLRNIGRCYQKMRQPERALDKFREYLAKDKKLGAEERAEIEGYIKEMEALRDEQAKQSTPPPPVAPINSTPTPTMSPPPAANLQPPVATTTSSATLVSPPVMGESPIYRKWWFWTGIGAVVAGGIVAAVLLSSGGTTRPDCPDGVSCMP
jgi:hypothetical protein